MTLISVIAKWLFLLVLDIQSTIKGFYIWKIGQETFTALEM